MTTSDDVRRQAERHLQQLVGDQGARLRPDQWSAIEALAVGHRRALVVQRTGWGKSAVYFVATLLLRSRGSGPTVIISPLLALMRNQIAAAERAGIRAVTINSTNREAWDPIQQQIADGEVDVLLVSPERLNNPTFRDHVLPALTATAGLLVVDEAHCISDWGHDFRPDYRRIATMLDDLPAGIPVLATTATANARVTRDVAEQLGDDVLVLRGSLDRETLDLAVVRLDTADDRLGWLADHLGELPGSGIIYCLTVSATQEVAHLLSESGHRVAAYSGQTEATERTRLEQHLLNGELKALVATSALGMGFDARLGFVVNLGAPASPVSYYQQVGRAGRGIDGHATVVLLPAREDREIWRYFASLAFPGEEHVRAVLHALHEADGPVSTALLETQVELGRNRLEMMLKVLDVDGAVRRERGGWTSTGQEWTYDAERYARVAQARHDEQQAMLAYVDTDGCRMRYLREQLDDPEAGDCGRCDNCGGWTPPTTVSEAARGAAHAELAAPGVVVTARKMWPTGLPQLGIDLRGTIADGPLEGRAAARLTDLGLGAELRAMFRPDADDAPVSSPLATAVLDTLSSWDLPDTPDVIVGFDSATRPVLVDSLVEGLSRAGRRPVVGRVRIADPGVPPGAGAVNSAQRVSAVTRRLALDLSESVDDRCVLLVDDLVVTGWSMTIAGTWLRQAGARSVVPLTLATQT